MLYGKGKIDKMFLNLFVLFGCFGVFMCPISRDNIDFCVDHKCNKTNSLCATPFIMKYEQMRCLNINMFGISGRIHILNIDKKHHHHYIIHRTVSTYRFDYEDSKWKIDINRRYYVWSNICHYEDIIIVPMLMQELL